MYFLNQQNAGAPKVIYSGAP